MADLRTTAFDIFEHGVAAADPEVGVRDALDRRPLDVVAGRTCVIAVGKGATRMLSGAQPSLPPAAEIILVTNPENAKPIDGATVFAAAHPVPDENGLTASRAVRDVLSTLGPDDQVLALISGGGSALLPAPVGDITLADKAALNAALLGSGADISVMNLIRQQVSDLKGGGLSRYADPAPVRALILSDVVGDDLAVIASGPTVAPIGNSLDAQFQAEFLGIWDDLPKSVQNHLLSDPDVPLTPVSDNTLVGSNTISVAAMAGAAPQAIQSDIPLEGDVEKAAVRIIAEATTAGTYIWGGETTVVLTGDGMGGRNQELALRVAILAEAEGWRDYTFLSGGTDGRDGPTDAAGGMVDDGTIARMKAAGVDPAALLENNDSYAALAASNDLLMIGATGTNVADLQVLIRR